MKQNPRAVLFDLDGTLLDTLSDLAHATNQAMRALGCPTHPLDAYRYFVGDGARNLCVRALPSARADLAEEAVRLMRQHYDAHCFDQTRLYPGIAELVGALTERHSTMAVLSNKPDDFTKRIVARYFPSHPFDAVRGQQEGIPMKPNPTAAWQIAEELGIPSADWLYLGDTNTDMRTAINAGMVPVGVLWGFRDKKELIEAGARMTVAHPDEVLTLRP